MDQAEYQKAYRQNYMTISPGRNIEDERPYFDPSMFQKPRQRKTSEENGCQCSLWKSALKTHWNGQLTTNAGHSSFDTPWKVSESYN